jgi:hypothetical protein
MGTNAIHVDAGFDCVDLHFDYGTLKIGMLRWYDC